MAYEWKQKEFTQEILRAYRANKDRKDWQDSARLHYPSLAEQFDVIDKENI